MNPTDSLTDSSLSHISPAFAVQSPVNRLLVLSAFFPLLSPALDCSSRLPLSPAALARASLPPPSLSLRSACSRCSLLTVYRRGKRRVCQERGEARKREAREGREGKEGRCNFGATVDSRLEASGQDSLSLRGNSRLRLSISSHLLPSFLRSCSRVPQSPHSLTYCPLHTHQRQQRKSLSLNLISFQQIACLHQSSNL